MDSSPTSKAQSSLQKTFTVQNKLGVHARPAAMIVRITSTYSGDVWVEKDDEQINGKSIMGLMMLAAGNGSKLNFLFEGATDEGEVLIEKLEKLFAQSFEEHSS
ncbi:MAG: HPr family phosphocarrier protein [Puniceicoccaceae bacterium]|nr:MAG: HPr family phosphocarrier protein [Puniceicoccaceae bacterium]